MKKNKKMSVGKKVAIGAGVATIGAGVDYFFGPNRTAHQKKKKKKKKKKKNKKMFGEKKGPMGAGVATIGAGVYYLLGPNSKAHQKKALALFSKMKKEAQSEIKKVKEVTVPLYNKAVDAISQNYAKQYAAHEKEIKVFAQKLKHDWKGISQKARKTVKKSIKTVKKNI